jgi:hypothetical protein
VEGKLKSTITSTLSKNEDEEKRNFNMEGVFVFRGFKKSFIGTRTESRLFVLKLKLSNVMFPCRLSSHLSSSSILSMMTIDDVGANDNTHTNA